MNNYVVLSDLIQALSSLRFLEGGVGVGGMAGLG